MINLSRISKTRCGLDVISVAYYPDNKEQFALRADIVNPETGETESDWFYDDGRYNRYKDTDYDLVEEPVSEEYSEVIPSGRVEAKQAVTEPTGAYTALLTTVIEDLYESVGILKGMQREMDSLTK